jgi:hypothetical protein
MLTSSFGRPFLTSPSRMASTMALDERKASRPQRSTQALPL